MSLQTIGSVCLVGAGKMGMALAKGWLSAGLAPAALTLVEPAPHESVQALAEAQGVRLVDSAPADVPDVLVLAVKPQVMPEVARGLSDLVGAQTLVISIAAGISIGALSGWLGTARVVRTMPNTPAQVGKGVTGLVAGPDVTDGDRAAADALMQAAGLVVWLDAESDIDAVTAISGSGPAYVFNFVEALAAAGVEMGLDADRSMLLARQLVIGAAALMDADPTDAATLRQNVTSPGGTTAEALNVLMAEDGLAPLLKRATEACRKRSIELGQ